MNRIRVAIIGNSHLVALKLGWDGAGEITRAFEPTFFAAGAGRLTLRVEAHRLVATDDIASEVARVSGGLTAIDVRDYDAFLLVGLLLRLRSVVEIYRTHRLPEHADSIHHVISQAVLRHAAYGVLASSSACQTFRQLRRISAAPCIIVAEPLPSLDISTSPETADLWGGEFIPSLYRLYREGLQQIAEQNDVDIITQPEDLVVPPCFSPAAYSGDSINLRNTKHRQSERFHMNAEYGVRILPDVLGHLAGMIRQL